MRSAEQNADTSVSLARQLIAFMASVASWLQKRSQLCGRLRVENVSMERCGLQVITLCVAWTSEQMCKCKELERRPRRTVNLNLPGCRQTGDPS